MKFHYSLISMALLMAGCGGEDAAQETSLPEYVYRLVERANVALNSKICLDRNQNFTCDSGEFTTQADSNGRFTLRSLDKSLYSLPILAEVSRASAARSADNDSANIVLAAPGLNRAGDRLINGVSTLFAALMVAGYTEATQLNSFSPSLNSVASPLPGICRRCLRKIH